MNKFKSYFLILIILSISWPSFSFATSAEDRVQLEKELEVLESQIQEHEASIHNFQAKGKNLQSEIKRLDTKIEKTKLQIKAINLRLSELDGDILDKQIKIRETEDKIDFNKDVLSSGLRKIYSGGRKNIVSLVLANENFSDFFSNMSRLASVESSLASTINLITDLKTDLENEKEILILKRTDANSLKEFQANEKALAESTKKERADLLKQTKGQEAKYQEILTATKKSAAQIRSRIFELLGGGQLSFEDAYQFAKIAEKATGVRAALILAILDRESALGQNVGRCSYKTAMHPTRDIPVFLSLTASLGLNPDSMLVSCANKDGAYGGAMGPSQFIPSTWKLYTDKVSAITGSNPASPWRNADAFVATGLYLKDAGAANADINQERIAAAKYYAGGRWRTYLWTYGDRVVTRARSFQADIDLLNS